VAQKIMTAPRRPTVSVCIANYNGMAVIDACIRSVLDQDCDFSVEVIVHDDASTDNSVPYIRERYPEVTVIESTKNVGFCIANNRMAQAAHGEYLLLLNNDAELFEDALRVLHDEALAIGTPAILGLPQYDAASGELIDRGSMLDPFLNPIPNLDSKRRDVGMVIGACLWVPQGLWQEIGGFPAWFHTLAEDMYLCCAARLRAYPVRALPDSGFRHWVGKSLGGGKVTTEKRLVTSVKRRSLSERNKTFVMILCYPPLLLLALLPLHLVLLHLEGALLALMKRNITLWRDIYAPLLPALWQVRKNLITMRQAIQGRRTSTLASFLAPFRWLPWKLEMLRRHGLPEVRNPKCPSTK
jgi:GT2 family glycosyltransferase